jgi:hypothetical protein
MEMIKIADTNGDDDVSLEDFLNLMRRAQLLEKH